MLWRSVVWYSPLSPLGVVDVVVVDVDIVIVDRFSLWVVIITVAVISPLFDNSYIILFFINLLTLLLIILISTLFCFVPTIGCIIRWILKL